MSYLGTSSGSIPGFVENRSVSSASMVVFRTQLDDLLSGI